MSEKIFFDPGHEGILPGLDPGAVGNGLKEAELTLKIVQYAVDYLKSNYTGHEIKVSRTGNAELPLDNRDDLADNWGADLFISVHINAGKGNGYESYIYSKLGSASRAKAISLQNVVNAEILDAMRKFGDIKAHGNNAAREANFSVLRETNMTALLTENLYIDSSDSKYLKNEDFLKAVGEAHGRGVAKYLGLPKKAVVEAAAKPKPATKGLYKVQVGAFGEKVNATALEKKLNAAGFKDTIIKFE